MDPRRNAHRHHATRQIAVDHGARTYNGRTTDTNQRKNYRSEAQVRKGSKR